MSSPDETTIAPGDVLLGKYRVESVLGRGAMGLVVAARHLALDERVAIKVLLPKYVRDPEILQRFLREGRAAVRVRSQHVVRVADVGTLESGAPYMVMDHLEGRDLAAVLAESGRLAVPVAVELVLQVCEALAEAHAQGIVHRDVKPSNLFVTRNADGSPCVKVLDFGISKMTHAEDHALTRVGGVLGSPLYMSPEQLRSSSDVDGRADIYSLGVVLFELLTGRTPFFAHELAQLVYLVTQGEPQRPRALRPDLPEPLEHVILAAIARDRDRRFPTVADLALALVPFAPPHARAAAERLFGALRGALPAVALPPGAARAATAVTAAGAILPASTVPLGGGALTIAPLGTTNRKPASREKRAAAIGLGLALASGGLLLWRLSDRAPSDIERETAASAGPQGAFPEPRPAQPSAGPEPRPAQPSAGPEPRPAQPSAAPEPRPVEPSAGPEPRPAQPSAAPDAAVEPAASAAPPSSAAPGASAEGPPPAARSAAPAAQKPARPGGSAQPAKRVAPQGKRPANADPFSRDVF
ncbi:Protein kinase [Sorangium cellulosum So ce56]|uniref:Protein kinase n=1 Tax=Sorangium cellulosum (strain So ce56) TaxID=448385 RepID=A9EWS2_SORC5|nr:serine/threonine-protein kinase [Sorangium cellulosum]CAN94346.1 Protein kinase [Sorangium cellulosum So ce56]